MLSFGIIASSASTQAGVTNWDFFAPTGDDYSMVAFGNGTAVTWRSSAGNSVFGYASNLTSAITAGQNLGAVGNVRDIYFGNGYFHAPGGVADTRRIVFSTNGTSWGTALNLTSQTGDNMTGFTFGNGLWIAPVRGDNDVYTSANGTAFTEQAGVLASGAWTDATWNGSVFGVYQSTRDGDAGSTSYYTSTNGTTWTARTLPATPASDVIAGSGVVGYLTSAANSLFYTSSNGTAFAIAGTAAFGASDTTRKLAFGNGVWVGLGENTGTVVARFSGDGGATWGTATFGSAITTAYDISFDSTTNAFYIVADAGSTTNVYRASVLS